MFEITQVVLVLVLNLRGKKAFPSVLLIILIMSFLLGHWKIFHGKIRVSSFIVTFACFAFAIEGLVPKKYFVRYSTPWRYQRPLEEIRETIVYYSCRYCLIFHWSLLRWSNCKDGFSPFCREVTGAYENFKESSDWARENKKICKNSEIM